MTNKYYIEGQERGQAVNRLFDIIAGRYDLINDLQSFGLHRWWKRKMIKRAAIRPGARALDLCCGTGDIAFALARRGLDVTGLDFTQAMLDVAEKRLNTQAESGETLKVRFVRGDALQIPFPEGSFDVVTIGYGLRNLADLEGGLRETKRVLRPGGQLLVLDFGRPDNRAWCAVYFWYLRHVCPLLGRLFCGDPQTHSYILESLMHYAAQKGVAARLAQLGFADVRVINLVGGIMSIHDAKKDA